jgi:hypothetical protein
VPSYSWITQGHGLQFRQRVDIGRVRARQSQLHGAHRLGSDARHAQQFQLLQRRREPFAAADHGGDRVSQPLQFDHGVDLPPGLAVDDIAEQPELTLGVDTGDPQCQKICASQGHAVVAGNPVGCGQHANVGVDHILHFQTRVGRRGRQPGNSAVDGAQVGIRAGILDAYDAGSLVGEPQRRGVGAVVEPDDVKRLTGRLGRLPGQLLQRAQPRQPGAVVRAVRNGALDDEQRRCVHTRHA